MYARYPYYPEGIDVGSHWLACDHVFKCEGIYPDLVGRVGRRYSMYSYHDGESYIFTDDDMAQNQFEEIDKEDLPLHLLGTCGVAS